MMHKCIKTPGPLLTHTSIYLRYNMCKCPFQASLIKWPEEGIEFPSERLQQRYSKPDSNGQLALHGPASSRAGLPGLLRFQPLVFVFQKIFQNPKFLSFWKYITPHNIKNITPTPTTHAISFELHILAAATFIPIASGITFRANTDEGCRWTVHATLCHEHHEELAAGGSAPLLWVSRDEEACCLIDGIILSCSGFCILLRCISSVWQIVLHSRNGGPEMGLDPQHKTAVSASSQPPFLQLQAEVSLCSCLQELLPALAWHSLLSPQHSASLLPHCGCVRVLSGRRLHVCIHTIAQKDKCSLKEGKTLSANYLILFQLS